MALITGLVVISFTVLTAGPLDGQTLDAGARAVALSNATVTSSGFPYEPVNPATPAGGSAGISFSFGESHALGELRYRSLAFVIPIGLTRVGGSVESFGFDAYRRTSAAAVASVSVPGGARVGVRLNGRHVAFRGYGARTAVGMSAGWTMSFDSRLSIGGIWRHVGSRTDAADRFLPQELSLGFEARASPEASVFGAVVCETGYPPDLRIGSEVAITDVFTIRVGSGTSPNRISFGFGLNVQPGLLHAAVSIHPILGPSIATTLAIQ